MVEPAPAPTPAPAPVAERTLPLKKGMEKVEDSGLEESLEEWAEGKNIDLAHVIKRTGVYVEISPLVKWDDNKKRARDPADHDRIVRESETLAKALVDAAKAGKTDAIKPLAEKLAQSCSECHNKYK